MRASALDLMRVLSAGILADEALAEEIARIADDGSTDDLDAGDALRPLARNHRIRALEGRARLAGITEAYGRLDPA